MFYKGKKWGGGTETGYAKGPRFLRYTPDYAQCTMNITWVNDMFTSPSGIIFLKKATIDLKESSVGSVSLNQNFYSLYDLVG